MSRDLGTCLRGAGKKKEMCGNFRGLRLGRDTAPPFSVLGGVVNAFKLLSVESLQDFLGVRLEVFFWFPCVVFRPISSPSYGVDPSLS
jgi:hypothetical protein